MVGADQFDQTAGERDSYWSEIDFPEPRARPLTAPAPVAAARRTLRGLVAVFVAALVVVAGGAYALDRVNGHAPVAGLHRQLEAQHTLLEQRAAKIAAQGRALAADEAELRSLRSQVSQSVATQTACHDAIVAADRAFGTESDALHALASADAAGAGALTDLFGTELDAYATARSTCLGTTTSV
jgi:hypothetical protein